MATGEEFPEDGLVPKRATQAQAFIDHFPEYDGRGVTIAILDSGIDPGAAGLQYTSTGKKKLIGTFDTSGGGDVDMSRVENKPLRVNEDGCIVLRGISGRELTLPQGIENPSGEWRLGIKSTYQLFPKALISRLKSERKEKFNHEHDAAIGKAISTLSEWDYKHGVQGKKKELSRTDLLERNEAKALVDALQTEKKNYSDNGPVADCVLWKGADDIWRALVDSHGTGNLQGRRPLRPFGVYGDEEPLEFDRWDEDSQLNFAINVYNSGKILSIVTDSSGHGTHVASIAAGYQSNRPELNGVAPGAQVVSMKIGDARLNGMETSFAIIRALNKCVELGVDIINMSYGEASALPDQGRVAELARELVERHGVLFVSSAGNSGPAMSTVGAPGSTSDVMIGVGAYVEPTMMLASYMFKAGSTLPPIGYTWSSRGPAYNGYLGVTISAPGGAFTSVPEWTLKGSAFMNGTSMASPNAAGGICLLLSSLKSQGIEYNSAIVKRALEASAKLVHGTEIHAQGRGLLQILAAHDLLVRKPAGIHSKVAFDIAITNSEARTNAAPAKGIYIREPWEAYPAGIREFSVSVKPRFPLAPDDVRPDLEPVYKHRLFVKKEEQKLMDVRVNLRSTAPWLIVPAHLCLNSDSKNFKVSVDLSSIPTSVSGSHQVPFAYVEAYDPSEDRDQGPLFTIPVTVIRPELCDGEHQDQVSPAVSVVRHRITPTKTYENVMFCPGHIMRHFLVVPPGARCMYLKITPGQGESTVPPGSSRTFAIRCLQQRQQSCHPADEDGITTTLRQEKGSIIIRTSPVTENGTVEVCVAQYWNSVGSGPLNIEARFYGVTANPSKVFFGPAIGGLNRVELTAGLSHVRVSPSGKFTTWCKTIRPNASETTISPLSMESRNAILGAHPASARPTYALQLTFSFKQLESCKTNVSLPLVDQLLYESPVDSRMCMLYDSNKRLIKVNDAWPKKFNLPKGDITAKVQITHEDRSMLEFLENMPMVITRDLSSDISVLCHRTMSLACQGKKSQFNKILNYGETCAIFLSIPPWSSIGSKLPKDISPGDCLRGTISYGKGHQLLSGMGKLTGEYDIEWTVTAAPGSGAESPTLMDETSTSDEGLKNEDTSPEMTEIGGPSISDNNKKEEQSKEISLEEAEYKHVKLPTIKTLLKSLQDMKKCDISATNNKIIESLETDFESILEQIKSSMQAFPKIMEELDMLALQFKSTKIQRVAHRSKAFLNVKPKSQQKEGDLTQLIEHCDDLIDSIDTNNLALSLSQTKPTCDLDGVGESGAHRASIKRTQEKRKLLLEALIVKTYALRFSTDAKLDGLISSFAQEKDTAFNILKMDRHTAQGRYASALAIFQEKFSDPCAKYDHVTALGSLDGRTLSDYKSSLFEALQLDHLKVKHENDKILLFAPDYVQF